MSRETLKRGRAAIGLVVCGLFASCRATGAGREHVAEVPVESSAARHETAERQDFVERDELAGRHELVERHEFVERHMGCTARIVIVAADAEAARDAARDAFAVIAQCDAELSDYRADNTVAELARRAGTGDLVPCGDVLLGALVRAARVTAATDGAFDVTIGPLVRLWREARRTHVLPETAAIEQARALCGGALVRDGTRLGLPRAGMALDFGGIGKGLAADRALACLRARGFGCALVGIEGDLALGAAPPGTRGWLVRATSGSAGDEETLALADCGVSTSGDTEQFDVFDGRRLSHVVDPRSGWPLEHNVRVTVIARDATDADAFATAFGVLERTRALEVAARAGGLELHRTEREAGGLACDATPGYARFVVRAAADVR